MSSEEKIQFIKDKRVIKPENFFNKFDYSYSCKDKAFSDYSHALNALLNDRDEQKKANKLISEFKVTSLCNNVFFSSKKSEKHFNIHTYCIAMENVH